MTTSEPRRAPRGFTLIEVVIVLAVVAILVGTAVPLTRVVLDQGRRDDVEAELLTLVDALDAFYFDHGRMPASLRAPDFLGVYLSSGVEDTAIADSWGSGSDYGYAVARDPDVATIWSRGPDGEDDAGTGDDIAVTVPGTAPGLHRTRLRMRVIIEVFAGFLESGGVITGDWDTDRANMGLGDAYALDGFGEPFTLDAASYVLRSAGPDRVSGNADDLTS